MEDERRAGVEMREGENKEKGCGKKEDKPTHTHTHTHVHTHTPFGLKSMRKIMLGLIQ